MKSIITVKVEGINKDIDFKLQQDGWYSNEEFKLSINPTLNSCVTDPDPSSNSYEFPIEVPSFKIYNIETLLLNVFNDTSNSNENKFSKDLFQSI